MQTPICCATLADPGPHVPVRFNLSCVCVYILRVCGCTEALAQSAANSEKQMWKRKTKKRISIVGHIVNYLLRGFVVCDVCLHTQRPLDVQIVLVQLQKEHNQHEQSVHHEEGKHRRIAQLY